MGVKWGVLVFAAALLLRLQGGQHYLTLTVDSVYYATAAERVSEGAWNETLSALWLPLLPYLTAPLLSIGLSSISAILLLNALSFILTLVLLCFLSRKTQGDTLIASLLFASFSRLVQEASTIGSDCVWLFINFGLFYTLFVYRGRFRTPILALGVAGAVFIRVPGILVAAWTVFIQRGKKDRGILLTTLFASVGVLCLIFQRKTGYFVPSLSVLLNHTYMNIEWMGRDESGFCRLYDGSNTLLGDFFFLEPGSNLPQAPSMDSSDVFQYRWATLIRYFMGILKIVPLPTVAVALWGLWVSRMNSDSRRRVIQAVLWVIVSTIGMVFATVVPRYFLPILPFVAFYGAVGVCDLRRRFHPAGKWVIAIVFLFHGVTILKETGIRSVWKYWTEPKIISVGQHLRTREGSGRRVASRWNFASVIEAGGRWKLPPCEGVETVAKYLKEKKIEFWIGSDRGDWVAKSLENQGILVREWTSQGESLYRVDWQGASNL